MINIQPDGTKLTRDELIEPIRAAFGANPDFYITISRVELLWTGEQGRFLLATYVEHQSGARNTIPPANDRIASVLFRFDAERDHLRWLHIHETALVMSG